MGRHHANKVAELARSGGGVRMAGVADIDGERAAAAAKTLGTRAVSDHRELFAQADVAIVAVSAVSHFEVARDALLAGLDVLV